MTLPHLFELALIFLKVAFQLLQGRRSFRHAECIRAIWKDRKRKWEVRIQQGRSKSLSMVSAGAVPAVAVDLAQLDRLVVTAMEVRSKSGGA